VIKLYYHTWVLLSILPSEINMRATPIKMIYFLFKEHAYPKLADYSMLERK
jgi:hypothetical protein